MSTALKYFNKLIIAAYLYRSRYKGLFCSIKILQKSCEYASHNKRNEDETINHTEKSKLPNFFEKMKTAVLKLTSPT